MNTHTHTHTCTNKPKSHTIDFQHTNNNNDYSTTIARRSIQASWAKKKELKFKTKNKISTWISFAKENYHFHSLTHRHECELTSLLICKRYYYDVVRRSEILEIVAKSKNKNSHKCMHTHTRSLTLSLVAHQLLTPNNNNKSNDNKPNTIDETLSQFSLLV